MECLVHESEETLVESEYAIFPEILPVSQLQFQQTVGMSRVHSVNVTNGCVIMTTEVDSPVQQVP